MILNWIMADSRGSVQICTNRLQNITKMNVKQVDPLFEPMFTVNDGYKKRHVLRVPMIT